MEYVIEKHTTVEYIICAKEDGLSVCVAKCNDESTAKNILGLIQPDRPAGKGE